MEEEQRRGARCGEGGKEGRGGPDGRKEDMNQEYVQLDLFCFKPNIIHLSVPVSTLISCHLNKVPVEFLAGFISAFVLCHWARSRHKHIWVQ